MKAIAFTTKSVILTAASAAGFSAGFVLALWISTQIG